MPPNQTKPKIKPLNKKPSKDTLINMMSNSESAKKDDKPQDAKTSAPAKPEETEEQKKYRDAMARLGYSAPKTE